MPATATATMTAPATVATAAANLAGRVISLPTTDTATIGTPASTPADPTAQPSTAATTNADAEYAAMEALATQALAALAEFEATRDRIKEYVQRSGRPVTANGEVFNFAPVTTYEFSLRQLIPLLRRNRVALADIATIAKPQMDRLLAGSLGEKIRPLVTDKVSQRFDHRKVDGGRSRSRRAVH